MKKTEKMERMKRVMMPPSVDEKIKALVERDGISESAWYRMAALEKLERDSRRKR